MKRQYPGNTRREAVQDEKSDRFPVRGDARGWIPAEIEPPIRFGDAHGFPAALRRVAGNPMTPAPDGGHAVFGTGIVADIRSGDAFRPAAMATAGPPASGTGRVLNAWPRRVPSAAPEAVDNLVHPFRKAYDVVQGMFGELLDAADTNAGDKKMDHHEAGGNRPRGNTVRGGSAPEKSGGNTVGGIRAGVGDETSRCSTGAVEAASARSGKMSAHQGTGTPRGAAAAPMRGVVRRAARGITRTSALVKMVVRWWWHQSPAPNTGFRRGAVPS